MRAPPPFHPQAVEIAYEAVWRDNPELDRRNLTVAAPDRRNRTAWMAAYHQALEDLGIPSATSRPGEEVGIPMVGPPQPPSGDLLVLVEDEVSGDPIFKASVQVSGPTVARIVSGRGGRARFGGLPRGEYEVLAVDPKHRMGQAKVVVQRGQVEVRVPCRRVCRTPEGSS